MGLVDSRYFRDFRAGVWVLGMLLGLALMTGKGESPKLELAVGSGATESLPVDFSFRFVVTVFLMPIETGSYQFTFKPYTVVGEDADLLDTGVAGEVVLQDSGKSIGSVLVQTGGEPVTVRLEAGKLYRMTLASLVSGLPADKSASVRVPAGLAAVISTPIDDPAWLEGVVGYISVPSDCLEIRALCGPRLTLISPRGVRSDLAPAGADPDGIVSLAVPAGESGHVWQVGSQTRGKVGFAGKVPPFINLNSRNFLQPSISGKRH